MTICPKCHSRHIANGMCVMCGTVVIHNVETPARTCLACGRKERFVGSVCRDCGDAISKGAKALQRAAQRNINSDKTPVFAECPAIKPLDVLYEKFHAQRERCRERSLRYKNLHRDRVRALGRDYYQRHAEEIREKRAELRKSDAYKQYNNAYRRTEQWREKERAHRTEQYRNDEEYRARKKEYARKYRERKRAEFLALSPDEQKARLAEYRKTDAYKKRLQRNREAYARMAADPERKERYDEHRRAYWAIDENRERRQGYMLRRRALENLIRENERLDRERGQEATDGQRQIDGGTYCGHPCEVRRNRDGGDNVGAGKLGVAIDCLMPHSKGPQVAEIGTV